MSSSVLNALGAILAVLALLVLGLRALAAAGHRMQQPATVDTHAPAEQTPDDTTPAVAAGPGYLSDDEKAAAEWCATTTRADLDRLNAICDRLVLHPLRAVCEHAIRELLRPDERDFVRIHSGQDDLVGVA